MLTHIHSLTVCGPWRKRQRQIQSEHGAVLWVGNGPSCVETGGRLWGPRLPFASIVIPITWSINKILLPLTFKIFNMIVIVLFPLLAFREPTGSKPIWKFSAVGRARRRFHVMFSVVCISLVLPLFSCALVWRRCPVRKALVSFMYNAFLN